MTYKQTLDYLFSKLPMYQRVGSAAYKANLDNTIAICHSLGNPEKKLKFVHVAGTNGKGSSSHMIAAILQKAGYKTGLYTSPHLVDFRERIKINGKMISQSEVVQFVETYKMIFEKVQPSFFEWTVGLAFHYFAKKDVDVVVLEVGLGGRLDSTNVINPIACLITNIGFDHMNLLGDSLPKIASEKAGIIKHKIPVTVSQSQLDVISVFNDKAKEMKAPIEFADKNYKIISHSHKDDKLYIEILYKKTNISHEFHLDLTGSYQLKNILGVLNTIDCLKHQGFIIEHEHIQEALANVCKLTGFHGRWQLLGTNPITIADTGHNEDGIKEVLENLKRYTYKTLHIVLGVVNDKDLSKIFHLLPKKAIYYFCKANIPRALDERELQHQAQLFGFNGKAFKTVSEAYANAKNKAKSNDLIFIGGSTFTVADIISHLKSH